MTTTNCPDCVSWQEADGGNCPLHSDVECERCGTTFAPDYQYTTMCMKCTDEMDIIKDEEDEAYQAYCDACSDGERAPDYARYIASAHAHLANEHGITNFADIKLVDGKWEAIDARAQMAEFAELCEADFPPCSVCHEKPGDDVTHICFDCYKKIEAWEAYYETTDLKVTCREEKLTYTNQFAQFVRKHEEQLNKRNCYPPTRKQIAQLWKLFHTPAQKTTWGKHMARYMAKKYSEDIDFTHCDKCDAEMWLMMPRDDYYAREIICPAHGHHYYSLMPGSRPIEIVEGLEDDEICEPETCECGAIITDGTGICNACYWKALEGTTEN